MALITDFFGKASIDTDHSVATTVTADRTAGVTVLSCFDLSTFTEDTPVYFVTYTKTTDPVTSEVTITDTVSWKGLVNAGANTITNLTVAPGYVDGGNTIGQFVECIPTSYWSNELVDGIQTEHNPDGTHSDVTATSVTTATLNSTTLADVGFLGDTEYFTASGTWTKPANLKFVEVEVVGGGGAGGRRTYSAAAGWTTAGGGGGGGGYALKKILAADLGATETVTVGAGGATSTLDPANSGGSSSFGSHCTANGGAGGESGGTTSGTDIGNGGAGGTTTGGDVSINGQTGCKAIAIGNNVPSTGAGGGGGSAFSNGSQAISGATGQVGNAPNGYGGGGAGIIGSSGVAAAGGDNGTAGIVIVKEYF